MEKFKPDIHKFIKNIVRKFALKHLKFIVPSIEGKLDFFLSCFCLFIICLFVFLCACVLVPGMRKLKELLRFHDKMDIILLESFTSVIELRKQMNDIKTGYLLFYPLNSYQENIIRDFYNNASG